jgi:FlaG/FlaF family flagellin (archaellin)
MPDKASAGRGGASVNLITFVAVVFVAVVFLGCRNDTNKNGSAQQTLTGPSPTPSPTPASTPKERLLPGDTIIVIKDGSVRIKPNKDVTTVKCDDDGSDSEHKKYKCEVELGRMGIQTATTGPEFVATDGGSTILVNEGDQQIEIKQNGGKVKIKFKKAHYDTCTDNAEEDCSIDAANRVKKITVDTPAFTKDCKPEDKCEVWVRKKP